MLFLLPIGLTLYVCYYLFRAVYRGLEFVTDLFPVPYSGLVASRIVVVAGSVLVLLGLVVLIGVFMRTVFGKACTPHSSNSSSW